MNRLIFILIVTVISLESHAGESERYFNITPKHCIVDEGEACEQTFIFSWHLSTAKNMCIFMVLEDVEHKIYCNQLAKKSSVELALQLEHDTLFRLVSDQDEMQQKVLVQVVGVDVRKVRRHVWSVF
ncbi:DUF3019 domain-containing protein [Thalassotalea sp. Y01]|uniref:DUF3019 domain-containing protein n=1 Tax=Thalassotalea sp. Y01 TaxID=2729613 RepID=UPI00145C4407|nr:DUF3019 domain-containing protein [Thalassotalea sp. Y01]NMP17523.1 DUF3019 domain-containing protein [Thalassotalea sp. Y01]